LSRASVELVCRADRNIAVPIHHDAGQGAGGGRPQIDHRAAVDLSIRPIAHRARREDDGHAGALQLGAAVHRKVASIDKVDSRIERHVRIGVELHSAAVDAGIDRHLFLCRKIVLVAA
jgi:hypothetical protein